MVTGDNSITRTILVHTIMYIPICTIMHDIVHASSIGMLAVYNWQWPLLGDSQGTTSLRSRTSQITTLNMAASTVKPTVTTQFSVTGQ